MAHQECAVDNEVLVLLFAFGGLHCMKFLEVAHPEGGRFIIHIDHLTSGHYRPAEKDVKARLGLDLDARQNEIVLFGDEAERAWGALQKLVVATTVSA